MTRKSLPNRKVGEEVNRMIAGTIAMPLIITRITPEYIFCGPYMFDRNTGMEIDEELGYSSYKSGSYIQ